MTNPALELVSADDSAPIELPPRSRLASGAIA
jgi:hypothetical protein